MSHGTHYKVFELDPAATAFLDVTENTEFLNLTFWGYAPGGAAYTMEIFYGDTIDASKTAAVASSLPTQVLPQDYGVLYPGTAKAGSTPPANFPKPRLKITNGGTKQVIYAWGVWEFSSSAA